MSQPPLSLLHLFSAIGPADADGWSARASGLMAAFGDRARHTIVSAAGDAADLHAALPPGIRHEIMQNPPPLAGRASVARYEAIARSMRGFDLVLSYGGGAIDGAMARRAFRRGAPPVVHHENPSAAQAGGARLYHRLALGAAEALVVPTSAAARAAQTWWKQPAARVQVIGAGVDLSAYAHGPDAATVAGFRRNPREVVIGVVADLSGAADVAVLVRAAAGLSGRFRLVVVGDGPGRGDVERAALAMGIDDRLVLPGVIAPASRFLGGFDLLALPPRGGVAPVPDAMAAGLPIVALRDDAVTALVAEENRPHLSEHAGEVQLRDAMQARVGDAALRATIGAANRARAARDHDGAAMIARSAALYAVAAGRPGGLG